MKLYRKSPALCNINYSIFICQKLREKTRRSCELETMEGAIWCGRQMRDTKSLVFSLIMKKNIVHVHMRYFPLYVILVKVARKMYTSVVYTMLLQVKALYAPSREAEITFNDKIDWFVFSHPLSTPPLFHPFLSRSHSTPPFLSYLR